MINKIALKLPDGTTILSPEGPEGFNFSGAKITDILTALLPYVFVFAGLTLFIFLIIGGFGMLTSAGSPDKMKAAQGKITSAIIGFIIIFISYWLMRILEIMFGIQIISIS
jgi:hypothetical protein